MDMKLKNRVLDTSGVSRLLLTAGESRMGDTSKLLRAYDVGRRLGCRGATIRKYALRGFIPGAVFFGNPDRPHIGFEPGAIEQFFASGGIKVLQKIAKGQRPELPAVPKQPEFTVRRHGHREHAGNAPRNDRVRRDPARELGDLVAPDPGVRDFDPMKTAPDLARVPAARYLPGGSAQV